MPLKEMGSSLIGFAVAWERCHGNDDAPPISPLLCISVFLSCILSFFLACTVLLGRGRRIGQPNNIYLFVVASTWVFGIWCCLLWAFGCGTVVFLQFSVLLATTSHSIKERDRKRERKRGIKIESYRCSFCCLLSLHGLLGIRFWARNPILFWSFVFQLVLLFGLFIGHDGCQGNVRC